MFETFRWFFSPVSISQYSQYFLCMFFDLFGLWFEVSTEMDTDSQTMQSSIQQRSTYSEVKSVLAREIPLLRITAQN